MLSAYYSILNEHELFVDDLTRLFVDHSRSAFADPELLKQQLDGLTGNENRSTSRRDYFESFLSGEVRQPPADMREAFHRFALTWKLPARAWNPMPSLLVEPDLDASFRDWREEQGSAKLILQR